MRCAAGAAVAAPLVIPAAALGKDAATPPSERIVAGCIGMGGRGSGHVNEIAAFGEVQVVAVCDVARAKAETVRNSVEARYAAQKTAGTYKGCTAYQDFRELLARTGH